MKTIVRLRRLDDQLGPPNRKPRDYFRIVLRRLDRIPGLEGAICRRTWWPNDIVHESVVLGTSSDGHERADEESDQLDCELPVETL
jgi:hypothetical protein